MKFFKRKKVITRMTDHGLEPYLIRWNIFECDLFSIKIHRILVSDDDCMHDHPWAFISFILKGGYVEQIPDYSEVTISRDLLSTTFSRDIAYLKSKKKLYGAGSILFRPADYVHRLEIYQPATTLVITFRKIKPWGFFTRSGFIHHSLYDKQVHCE